MNVTQRRVLPFDPEAKLSFMKLPSKIRQSLNDLAAASGCSPFEIVQRFRECAGYADFPEPPPTLKRAASATVLEPRSSRPAKASKSGS
jgi:hypothetical protein